MDVFIRVAQALQHAPDRDNLVRANRYWHRAYNKGRLSESEDRLCAEASIRRNIELLRGDEMNNCKVCDDDGLNCNSCGFDPEKAMSAEEQILDATINVLRNAPIDCLGEGRSSECAPWPIRDEMVAALSRLSEGVARLQQENAELKEKIEKADRYTIEAFARIDELKAQLQQRVPDQEPIAFTVQPYQELNEIPIFADEDKAKQFATELEGNGYDKPFVTPLYIAPQPPEAGKQPPTLPAALEVIKAHGVTGAMLDAGRKAHYRAEIECNALLNPEGMGLRSNRAAHVYNAMLDAVKE